MKIILPKSDAKGKYTYSYSQHKKWKDKKKDYIRKYFFGEKFKGNDFTKYGNKVGDAIPKNNWSDFNKAEVKVLEKVTRLDEFERPIRLNFDDFYLIGYIDSNDKELTTLIDYKTGGLDKVSVYEDDSYIQLAVYAAAIEQETGKLPKEAFVELIERTGNPWKGDELAIGKKIVKIPQDISPKKIKEVTKDLEKAVEEISEHYKVFEVLNNILV